MRINIATQMFLKLNLSSNTIQSPSPLAPPYDTNIFKQILMQLNEWVAFLPNLVANLAAFFPNLIHSIFAKLGAFFHNFIDSMVVILKGALPFVVAAIGVVALCLFCYFFFSAIIGCVSLVALGCWICIRWLLMMLWHVFMFVFSCCGRVMVAPGTRGALLIPRALFEAAPRASFAVLRVITRTCL